MKTVVVSRWFWDEPYAKAQTNVHVVDNEEMIAHVLGKGGEGPQEFFRRLFAFEEFVRLFPGSMIPDPRTSPGWDSLMWNEFPSEEGQLQRLADTLSMRIMIFTHTRGMIAPAHTITVSPRGWWNKAQKWLLVRLRRQWPLAKTVV